jgi:ATP-dependent helicase/nuclease subunit A
MGVLVDWPGEATHPRRFVFLASEKQPPACARDALEQEQQARALEELNALYVALTRAEHQVVVSSFDPHSRGQARSWAQRLRPLAEPVPAPEAASPAAERDQAIWLPELPAWSPPAPPPAAPAVAEDDATRIGKAMHRLLQWLPTPLRDFRWGEAHAQAVAKEFALDRQQANQALQAAQSVLDGEAAWAWDAQHLNHWGNEVELWHQGERLRLDRLVRERASGCWWVLDFKSTDTPQHKPELLAQLRRYREALQAAHPGQPLRLAFINAKGRLIEPALDVPDAC